MNTPLYLGYNLKYSQTTEPNMDYNRAATTKDGGEIHGISQVAFLTRSKQMAGHPQPLRDERLGRLFWSLDELMAFSRDYHARNPARCLFSARRLRAMTPAELELWGVSVEEGRTG